ncbi:MAG: cobalamin-binding protein [Propionibacteriales bacterium]|nr:cobalamin-binding protein [Propionibacteriales bacterium]
MRDDMGTTINPPRAPRRVVSLVPSLTESIAATERDVLIAATDWCTHPEDLDVIRIRGTKNPDTKKIVSLAPDIVVANAEENREIDVRRLRDAGIPVWVTAPATVPEALASLRRTLTVLDLPHPRWLDEAERVWSHPVPLAHTRAIVPIWRDPWMALGRDTFAGDLLARLGVRNALADSPSRYPHVDLASLPAYDLVVLPDEPYVFTPDDGPEAFPGRRCACVSGRHLTWYGPSLVEAKEVLLRQLSSGG